MNSFQKGSRMSMQEASQMSNSSSGMMMSHASGMSSVNNNSITSNQNKDNCKVVVRVRPPLPREIEDNRFISTIQVSPDGKKICIYEYYNIELVEADQLQEYLNNPNSYTMHQFSFDQVYDQDSTQEEVYETTAKHSVLNTLSGFNATIMAYGQTGTGKTFTMEGFKYNSMDPQRGIIPRSIEEIFKYIENCSNESQTQFIVRASYLQIYNEVISDLIRTDRNNLHIREDKKRGVFVDGLSEWAVRNPSEIFSLIQRGAQFRRTAATKMNDVSSRSHAVFIIIVEQMTMIQNDSQPQQPKQIKVGKLNLVDLAGSERVSVTGATGKRLEECKKINQSLSCLGNVISALTDSKGVKAHIPYRDSKLTRLLEDSLGGNCKTTMMAMISPALESFSEGLNSLKFANRAKNIKNQPIVNEDLDQRALLRKYEVELRSLKNELEERNKLLIDKSRVIQLEEDKKRAELDRKNAMVALEKRSKEFFQEREEKKKLEEKIRSINTQILVGGQKIEDTPQFRSALEEQQKLIREQYEKRLQDLEKEREQIVEDKVQVDRYKQLLLKQRDIMIALTTRLNERDETIIQLQEELDAYDRIHRETEDALENQTGRVQQLEQILKENSINVPKQERGGILQNKHMAQQLETFDGQPFNITRENLMINQEVVGRLQQENDQQREEIDRLRSELDSNASSPQNNNSNGSIAVYQQQINQLQEKLLQQQVYHKQQLIAQTQQSETANQRSCQILFDQLLGIKNSVDNIVYVLSQPNEDKKNDKLHSVALDLLGLQKLIGDNLQIQERMASRSASISSSQQKNTTVFQNIGNTMQPQQQQQQQPQAGFQKGQPQPQPSSGGKFGAGFTKSTNGTVAIMNSQENNSNARKSINVEELIRQREAKRNGQI